MRTLSANRIGTGRRSLGTTGWMRRLGRGLGLPLLVIVGLSIGSRVEALERIDALQLAAGEEDLIAALIDPQGQFAYFATNDVPTRVIKIDLDSFARVGAIELEPGAAVFRAGAVIDPGGQFAYFGVAGDPNGDPAHIIKIDLDTFTLVDNLELEPDILETDAAVIESDGQFAYFSAATTTDQSRVVKIDLSVFAQVGVIDVDAEIIGSAVIDPQDQFAYFGTADPIVDPAQVVKIDLGTFAQVDILELEAGEAVLETAVIDPAGEFAYFGTVRQDDGRVVKIALDDFTRVAGLELDTEEYNLYSAVMDPQGRFAYFGTSTSPGRVVEIDLDTFQRVDGIELEFGEGNLRTAVIDPEGRFAYFGTFDDPGVVIKVGVGPPFVPTALAVDSTPILSDGNAVFELGERVEVAPSWRNNGILPQLVDGIASGFTGPAGPSYDLVVDVADYGEIAPGSAASCQDNDACYQMEVGPSGAPRPAQHWDSVFDETLSDDTAKTWTLHFGESFADTPRPHLFYRFVETIFHHQVTVGCNATDYCPGNANTRAQMSVFVLRSLEGPGYQPPACQEGEERFDDVPADDIFCAWIEELAERGVVVGCGDGNFCPGDSVTRAQMSIFLLKTLEGTDYAPPECSGLFADVDCPSLFGDWIEDLFLRQITEGCETDPLVYCPGEPVSRGQMAVFLSRTFGLELYGP